MKSNLPFGAGRSAYFNSYVKGVLKLVKGNALAQLITFAATPFIARLYSKEEFGVLAVVVSASAVLSIVVSLKLELSIFNSRKESQLHHALFSAVITSIFNAFAFAALIFIFSNTLSAWLNVPTAVLFFIPPFAFLLAIFNTITNFLVYKGLYSSANSGKVSKSVITVISQFVLASAGKGLLISEALGRCAASIFSMKGNWRDITQYKVGFSFKKQLTLSKSFIKYSVPAGLMNSASLQLPSLFLAYQYGAAAAGVYFLVNRVAAAPLALVGQSMSQAFSSQFSKLDCSNNRKELVNKVILKSFLVSLVIFSLVYIGAPSVSQFLFGDGWGMRGVSYAY
ncbi:lipopolysaccharide biosynthesis protein [Pseudoalteromonas sp. GB56]